MASVFVMYFPVMMNMVPGVGSGRFFSFFLHGGLARIGCMYGVFCIAFSYSKLELLSLATTLKRKTFAKSTYESDCS